MVSCLYPVEKGLVVRTRTETVDKIRRVIVEELMAHAPDAPELVRLAEVYGADRNRFEKEASFCVLCGLCVRYCAEVKQKHAVGFIENGPAREISFIPEIAANMPDIAKTMTLILGTLMPSCRRTSSLPPSARM